MDTPNNEVPVAPVVLDPVLEKPAKTPTVCFFCENPLEHADVAIIGTSVEDKMIVVHPRCMNPGKNDKIKNLSNIYIHLDEGRSISPAKQIIVSKRVREIMRAVRKANEARQLKEQQSS